MRVVWDLFVVMRDGVVLTPSDSVAVVLSQVQDGQRGWPRLEGLDPQTLRTVAIMWGPKVGLSPAGATAEGLDDLDTPKRIGWLLRNPRPLVDPNRAVPDDAWMLGL